jgi:Ser/Thr protein kinase RdoA (MazF antagonist)
LGIGADALIGWGGQSWVYALDEQRVLRVLRRPGDPAELARLRAFLSEIDGRLAVPTSVIETIDQEGRFTIERRLPGLPLLALLPRLGSAERKTVIARYVAGAEATGKLLLPERPYGHVLGPSPMTAETWTGFFRLSLDHWLAQNGATIAAITGSIERVSANALALLAALPEQPPKALAHGDYFPGNVLFDERLELSGVVDFSVYTLVGDPLYDAVTAPLFLEMIAEAGPDDVAFARQQVLSRHGEAILPVGCFYRAYAAILMADPANQAPPYPRLFQWSVANLKALAAGKMAF